MKSVHTFPNNFVWGTATSAHQTEGNNINSDWWEWEQNRSDKSGIACDSYNRFEEDFNLCKQLNNNAVRISIEWARIEPEKDNFDQKEIEHYKKVLQSAKNNGLKTFVTLHHFTNPAWFLKMGGWTRLSSAKLFSRYAKKCSEEFSNLVDVFLTINEPQVYALQSYIRGKWPPNKKNLLSSLLVQINMIRSHNKAYKSIKNIADIPVGIAKNVVWCETKSKKPLDKIVCRILNFVGRDFFLLPTKKCLDLVGLNYYLTIRIMNLKISNPQSPTSDIGWGINPIGIKNVLFALKKYNLPIYITENGLADAYDMKREKYIKEHLIECAAAMDAGVNLKGYFHWSLIDNYEWNKGFTPKFGLVEIDRNNNLERKPRKSFYYYANVCKNNGVVT